MRIANFNDASDEITIVDSFGWYGEDIRINPEFSPLDLIDLAEEVAAQQGEAQQIAQALLLKKSFRLLIHPGDFERFWSVAKSRRVSPENLAKVQQSVIEYVAGRPTVPQSDSSVGQSNAAPISESTQNAPVSPLTAMDVRVAERDMVGRPDLRTGLLNLAEHRIAREA